jgi:hypothetical protein
MSIREPTLNGSASAMFTLTITGNVAACRFVRAAETEWVQEG